MPVHLWTSKARTSSCIASGAQLRPPQEQTLQTHPCLTELIGNGRPASLPARCQLAKRLKGVPDMRKESGSSGKLPLQSQAEDVFFAELYHSTAERLPEQWQAFAAPDRVDEGFQSGCYHQALLCSCSGSLRLCGRSWAL